MLRDMGGRMARGPQFWSEERGAAVLEYGMMVALAAMLVMGALYLLGGSISAKLTQIATCVSTRVCS
jgi:Flp pilus assembly pilin Flp